MTHAIVYASGPYKGDVLYESTEQGCKDLLARLNDHRLEIVEIGPMKVIFPHG
ncbi:MAG TPA: hypothetical protein VHA06_07730 [Candidatus Angelobacter sp.]|jgi:hypothetical protein|nr:hypothetical protein [Candidatus Angelobacter sp.]